MKFAQIEPLEARIAPATLSISPVSVVEGNSGKTAATFTVTLSEATAGGVTVAFATSDGTAVAGGLFPDYEAQQGTLTFSDTETSKTITVQVLGERIQEATEDFRVTLSNPTIATIDTAEATGTIQNDGDTLTGISISNAADVTEGAAVTSKFTVTLAAAVTSAVTVTYATGAGADSAKPGPGAFTDYTPTTGTVTFAPGGPLTQEISVPILDDSFSEATEQFTTTLTAATNAALSAKPAAIGKILNDVDATVGITMGDLQQVEGSTNSTLVFKPTLSGPLGSAVTFTATTQNGTAVAATDFISKTQSLTIAAGQTSVDFSVTLRGDSAFETAESFFVSLTGLPGTVTPVNQNFVNPAAQLTARAYLLDDDFGVVGTKQVRWTDIDGDLVTLTVSKGVLGDAFGQLNTDAVNLVSKGTVGGLELLLLNLNNRAFAGANVSVTAEKQPGFPGTTNGRVDVGYLQTATFIPSELQVRGVDLGTVTIDGDLAKLTVGDQFSTPAIRRLDVYSLGVNATTLSGLTDTFRNTQSDVLGPISTVKVKTDVAGYLHIVGAEFGNIGTLTVGGALKGGADENSGRITASGKIARATLGSIVGGAGANSGLLSGTDLTNGVLGTVTVLGDVRGGTGPSSGTIFSTLNLASVTIKGSLVGGSGSGSGGIVAGGTISKIVIDQDVKGGDSIATTFLDKSGYISATQLSSVKISGSITAGKDLGRGIASSGSIRADVIGSLEITGNVTGHKSTGATDPTVPVIISASGLTNLLAIKNVKIGGDVKDAEILAGYASSNTAAQFTAGNLPRGTAINGDASIGTVDIGGAVTALNIVAGAEPDADKRFGTVGNTMIKQVANVSRNDFFLFSQIASVIIRGAVETNDAIYGVVAQTIGSVKFGPTGTVVPLTAGPGNDTPAKVLGTATKFQAVELPII